MNINWKQKLSSRKFWGMLAGQGTAVLTAFNAGESTVLKVGAVIASIGSICVYMLAETATDTARAKSETDRVD